MHWKPTFLNFLYKSESVLWKFVENENKFQGDNLHCACIKDFDMFLYNKTNNKERKNSFMNCLECFSSEKTLTKDQKVCLNV